MAKYVDVEKVFCADCEDRDRCGSPDVFCDVHSMPAADVAPVVHGRWITDSLLTTCSICQRSFNILPMFACFCPNCGADMRERKGDDGKID